MKQPLGTSKRGMISDNRNDYCSTTYSRKDNRISASNEGMLPAGMVPLLLLTVFFALGCCESSVSVTKEISFSDTTTNEYGADTFSRSSTLYSSPATSTVTGTPLTSAASSPEKHNENLSILDEISPLHIFSKIRDKLHSFLPLLLDNIPETMASAFLPQARCQLDIIYAVKAAMSGELWALKLLDSWGKPYSFLQVTDFQIPGDYDQCRHTEAPSKDVNGSVLYRGNYCVVTVVPAALKNERRTRLDYGTCMPDTCSQEDITNLVNNGLRILNLSAVIYSLETDCRTERTEITAPTVIAIVLLCIIGLLVLTGTVVDIVFVNRPRWCGLLSTSTHRPVDSEMQEVGLNCHQTDIGLNDVNELKQTNQWKCSDPSASCDTLGDPERSKDSLTGRKSYNNFLQGDVGKILLAFSIFSNTKSFLNTNQNPESLPAIDGIRVISAWWIVFCHLTFVGFVNAGKNIEIKIYKVYLQKRVFDFASRGTFPVDTYFSISGLLASYLISKEMQKKGWKIKWHKVFFHRYLRITVPYLLVLVTALGLGKFMGSGAMWPNSQPEYLRSCEKYWWTNLLYINNLISPIDTCGAHFWYLAVDMQFFLLIPLMLIPFCINMYAGLGSCLVFLLINWITAGVLSAEKNWPVDIELIPMIFLTASSKEIFKLVQIEHTYWNYYYVLPFTRIGPYVMGVLAGKFLAVTNRQFKMQWYVATLCWIIAFATGLAVIYGSHDNSEGRIVTTLYNAVTRTAWGACICWVVVACASGYGGPVTDLLSWSPFVVLGRLTFMIYLIQLTVIDVSFGNMDRGVYLSQTSLIELYIGLNTALHLVSFVLVLCFEMPFLKLEKIILPK